MLLGFKLDDVADLRLFDRRQFHEPCQTALAGNADADDVVLQLIAREELIECLAGECVGVGVGLRENLRVFDVIERGGRRHAVDNLQPQCL